MIVNYHIKLFGTGAGKYFGILMSLLLLISQTIIEQQKICCLWDKGQAFGKLREPLYQEKLIDRKSYF